MTDYAFVLWWEKMKALVVHPYDGDDFQSFVAVLCSIAWDKGYKNGVTKGEFASADRHQRRLEVAAVLKDEDLIIDAFRYRWLKSRHNLELHSIGTPGTEWTHPDGYTYYASHQLAEGGTSHVACPTLDRTIDKAILVSLEREQSHHETEPEQSHDQAS